MKKILTILLIFGVFFATFASFNTTFADVETYIVTANSATIFEEPDFSSQKLETLSHKDEVALQMENGQPVLAESADGWKFFLTESGGYIFADLVTKSTEVVTSIPNFNAKTNTSCTVFFQEDLALVESDITLKKGERIFLYEGYNSKSTYTAIAVLVDNQVIYGFLKTSVINPDGIDPLIVTCACLILAALGIIFAWVFMKRRKRNP